MVKDADDIARAIDKAQEIDGLRGIVIIKGNKIGIWGKVTIVPLS